MRVSPLLKMTTHLIIAMSTQPKLHYRFSRTKLQIALLIMHKTLQRLCVPALWHNLCKIAKNGHKCKIMLYISTIRVGTQIQMPATNRKCLNYNNNTIGGKGCSHKDK